MSALRRLLEVAVTPPCERGAPLLQKLVDGELAEEKAREAKLHLELCEPCRGHVRLLELEEQTVREIAAPTPRRFVALWSDRLGERMAAAVAEEAGERLIRHAFALARGDVARQDDSTESPDSASCAPLERYVEQLEQWLRRGDSGEPIRADVDADADVLSIASERGACPTDFERCLAAFERLLGSDWPPALAARRISACCVLRARRVTRPTSRPPRS